MGMRSLRKRDIKMGQVLVLKQIILRRFANARKAVATVGYAFRPRKWRYFTFDSDEEEPGKSGPLPMDVPKGHFAVYVGTKRSRFIIPTAYLNHPLFQALLQKAEEEFGFEQRMGLTIPCEEVAFEYITSLLANQDPVLRDVELDELMDAYTKNAVDRTLTS